jgi:hypothetical protein
MANNRMLVGISVVGGASIDQISSCWFVVGTATTRASKLKRSRDGSVTEVRQARPRRVQNLCTRLSALSPRAGYSTIQWHEVSKDFTHHRSNLLCSLSQDCVPLEAAHLPLQWLSLTLPLPSLGKP